MGWITPEAVPVHECVFPRNFKRKSRPEGSQWECDECGAVYEVQYSQMGFYWKFLPVTYRGY